MEDRMADRSSFAARASEDRWLIRRRSELWRDEPLRVDG